jgi:biopolymer transport protein ExbD
MRIPSTHDRDDVRENTAMTPMIDVVFLLLIFFVCASVGQIRESILPTDLATGSIDSPNVHEIERPLGEMWLRLDRAEERTMVEVNNRRLADFGELQTLLTSMAEVARDMPVILDIAPQVPLGDLIRVYDTCRASGFESINFATDASASNDGKMKDE